MFVIKKEKNQILSLPVKEITAKEAKNFSSDLALKILKLLIKKPMYPIELAKELKVHEQKIYYHIRNLERSGIIKINKKEIKQGAVAKYYYLDKPAFVIRLKEFEETQKIIPKSSSEFLEPFIKNGELDAMIIVGSPDPHGPEKARSRDGYYGIDLALFLGTFLNYVPDLNVRLDTEVRQEDLKNNLILLGGPVVNNITKEVNEKMPIFFDKNNHWAIKSNISKNVYPTDETGLIASFKNPFNKEKSILLVAGKRYSGTRAAIIAFLKYFKEVSKGNIHNNKIKARVVEGIDLDSDGIIDDVEFRE